MRFRDLAVNDAFSFPPGPYGHTADPDGYVKLSARTWSHRTYGRGTVGSINVDVIARGPRDGGMLSVLRPNGVELESIPLPYLTRDVVAHAAGDASSRCRNDRGWTPYFRLVRADGIDVTARWSDILGR